MSKQSPENHIKMFFHCKQCIAEIPGDQTPREWIRVEVGWTEKGLQVWCVRHEINIVDLDFDEEEPATT